MFMRGSCCSDIPDGLMIRDFRRGPCLLPIPYVQRHIPTWTLRDAWILFGLAEVTFLYSLDLHKCCLCLPGVALEIYLRCSHSAKSFRPCRQRPSRAYGILRFGHMCAGL
ncbi:unnamed protein product [Symbiodinium sp. CCMP2456]|nr:unnamed protein product [Symbiodinium sp. CCMP2456]